jgi:hypothetical protein
MGFMPLKIRWQRGTTAHQEQSQNGDDKSKFVSACHGNGKDPVSDAPDTICIKPFLFHI